MRLVFYQPKFYFFIFAPPISWGESWAWPNSLVRWLSGQIKNKKEKEK